VARSLCTCGRQLLWKADEPDSDEWLLASLRDLPDDISQIWLHATMAVFCPDCGRLWVAWVPDGELSEYVPVDPAVRPVRPTRDGLEKP
jgi:hypothetical protein